MNRVIIAAVSLVVLAGCNSRSERTYTFSELAYPDAKSTVASGINPAGHVVGWYEREDLTHGFVYKDGTYSTIQYPGAALTQLYGIAANGQMAGGFRMPDETNPLAYHGFVVTTSGELRPVGHPDYEYGMALRVLADGSVVGCAHQKEGLSSMRGMTIPAEVIGGATSSPAAIKILDAAGSMHNGATPDGTKLVGVLSERGEAYVVDRGVLSTFRAPDAKRTEAWDINQQGVIVGVLVDSQSASHGFVLENGRYTRVDFPGAKSTVTFGINAGGDIVGAFETADGQRRAYLARRR